VADGDHHLGVISGFFFLLRRSETFKFAVDRISLKLPVIGNILEKATIARWTRTFGHHVSPPGGPRWSESLGWERVAGASGNAVFIAGTRKNPDRRQHRHEA